MRKRICVVLCMLMIFMLAACGNSGASEKEEIQDAKETEFEDQENVYRRIPTPSTT